MTPRLPRLAFFVVFVIVAITLVVNLPPLEEVGKTPASDFVTFSLDHGETEIHRNLKKARHAEMRADHLRRQDSPEASGYYRDALYYLDRARNYAERRGSGSYINHLIDRTHERIHEKIALSRKDDS